jgi:predicted RNase H-like HicB family nuclease
MTIDAEEDKGTESGVAKGRFPMATGQRKSHHLGASASGKGDHSVGERRKGREEISGKRRRRASQHRAGAATVKLQYSMLIRWSNEDRVYIAVLPEFHNAKTHGETYEKAAKEGRELIESFIMWYRQDGKPLPSPQTFDEQPDDSSGVVRELAATV